MCSTTTEVTDEASQTLCIRDFFSSFLKAKGAVSTILITVCLSFASGCTVACVPEILSDRYARLHHGYGWDLPQCSSFDDQSMPLACRKGADDAQDSSAWSSMLQNLMTLFFNPVLGRVSDIHGRRRIFILSTFCYTCAPIVLVLMQVLPGLDPIFYYLSNSLIGVVSYLSVAFAILSDSVPNEYRAPSFGIAMAARYGGFAFSPFSGLLLNHMQVSILSMVLAVMAFLCTLVGFPETLPDSVSENNRQQFSETVVDDAESEQNCWSSACQALTRPFHEMKILNRDKALRLVAVGSFFSSMVYSTDVNLLIFYIEEYLNVREQDIAFQFLVMGVVGVIIQALLLQPMIQLLGEKGLLILSFLSGTLHNFLYGVAKNKRTLYLALSLSQLTKTNTPILASLASKDATVNEQGQLQGALYAVNALSAAIGPMAMQLICERTKDTTGPGTMFVFASFLYFVGTIVVSLIPVETIRERNGPTTAEPSRSGMVNLEEPLLSQSDETSAEPSWSGMVSVEEPLLPQSMETLA